MSRAKVAEQKAALRARFRSARAAVAEREAVDAAIVAGVLALPEVTEARTVLLFWPLVARGEVDVRPLATALLELDVGVALPAIVPGEAPQLVARRFAGEARLVAGRFGIREPPPEAEHLDPLALGVVVVPALAAGRDGSRLGYGGGYYDAFLAALPAFRVGVVPHACLVDALPSEPHDARLDGVVTERATVRVAGRASAC